MLNKKKMATKQKQKYEIKWRAPNNFKFMQFLQNLMQGKAENRKTDNTQGKKVVEN